MTLDYLSAFIVGILGAGHCIAMCGGICALLTTGTSNNSNNLLSIVLSYNLGRIISYGIAGAIAGFTGSLAIKTIGLHIAWLRMLAGLFLILLGLYIGKWLFWLNKIENVGKLLWQQISPLTKKFLPIDSAMSAVSLGVLWGWLPCGLVYSTLTWSIASGDPIKGSIIMLSFGLGTLPALLTVSLGSNKIGVLLTNTKFRQLAAISIVFYGLYSVKIAYYFSSNY